MKMKVSFTLTPKKLVKITSCDEQGEEEASTSDEVRVKTGENGEIDWLQMARDSGPKRRRQSTTSLSELKTRGEQLACDCKYIDAITCFEQALCLDPTCAELHEMIAQSYLELDKPLDAIVSAQSAVKLSPNWSTAKQTLGRAQLNLGEINLALKSFKKAVHLTPFDRELFDIDLRPCWLLLKTAEQIGDDKGEESNKDGVAQDKYFNASSAVVPEGYTVLRLIKPTTFKEK